jgi:uncharacterized protein
MKRRLALLFLWLLICAGTLYAQDKLPSPTGLVNDFAGVLSGDDKGKLEALFLELQSKTGAEIAVVTIATTRPVGIERYAVDLFAKWGIGQKGKDNGILLLVALKDRKVRIEVGYGLEGAVPDALAMKIINTSILPSFKRGAYSQGIIQGSVALVDLVAREYKVTLSASEDLASRSAQGQKGSLPTLVFFLLVIMFGGLRGLFFWSILTSAGGRRRGGSWYGSGMGGSSGGFGGGFGGFGGGFSGGGGASGGW